MRHKGFHSSHVFHQVFPAVSWHLMTGQKDQAFQEVPAAPEMNHLSWELQRINLVPGPLMLLYPVKRFEFCTKYLRFLLEEVVGDKAKHMDDEVANSRPLICKTECQPCVMFSRKAH